MCAKLVCAVGFLRAPCCLFLLHWFFRLFRRVFLQVCLCVNLYIKSTDNDFMQKMTLRDIRGIYVMRAGKKCLLEFMQCLKSDPEAECRCSMSSAVCAALPKLLVITAVLLSISYYYFVNSRNWASNSIGVNFRFLQKITQWLLTVELRRFAFYIINYYCWRRELTCICVESVLKVSAKHCQMNTKPNLRCLGEKRAMLPFLPLACHLLFIAF